MSKVGVACLQCKRDVLSGCSMFSVSAACPLLVWYVLNGSAMSQVGLSMASIGPQLVWHGLCVFGMSIIGEAWPQ